MSISTVSLIIYITTLNILLFILSQIIFQNLSSKINHLLMNLTISLALHLTSYISDA